jgi:hypothetical protein
MNDEVKKDIQELIPEEGYEETSEGTLTDEEIAELQPVAEEWAEEVEEIKLEKANIITATKKLIFARAEQPFDLFVPMGEDVWKFKVRRMKEKDRVKFQRLATLQMKTLDQLSEKEFADIVDQSYEMMADLILEPEMSVDEWKESADLPLLSYLSNKVAILSYERDDSKIAKEFRKN